MRIPRKLKKGCRTLNGNPRTKWQRKGRLHIVKILNNVAKTACAAAVGMDLLRQAFERISPVTFPSGGIVVTPPPKVGVAQMPTGEMVLNREQVAKLKDCLTIQVSKEDVNSPDFNLYNFLNKKFKEAWFKKVQEFEQKQHYFPFNNLK